MFVKDFLQQFNFIFYCRFYFCNYLFLIGNIFLEPHHLVLNIFKRLDWYHLNIGLININSTRESFRRQP
ncbi:hypothetical protein C2G38_1691421 [Gigaspora rosea]|uniref:Uncharacterized protein n=1 Tax=Gigaspora rosea TaxID=44941 RepID=A0A397UWH0_9GLOM|nr:hypothetical protein C2G38_1691421 [Gigaspora rosea]